MSFPTITLGLALALPSLGAQEPIATVTAPDLGATMRRLDALIESAPLDTELRVGLGLAKFRLRTEAGLSWSQLTELMDEATLHLSYDTAASNASSEGPYLRIDLAERKRSAWSQRRLTRFAERTGLTLRDGILELGKGPRPSANEATTADARLRLDLERLRKLSPPDTPDPLGAFLISSLMPLLDEASSAEVELRIDQRGVHATSSFDASASSDPGWAALLGRGQDGYSPPPAPAGTAFALHLDRNLRGLFTEADRLFSEAEQLEIRTGISQIETLMGEGSLVDDVLPEIEAPWSLFVTAPPPVEAPAAVGDSPIVLPGFALVVPSGGGAHTLLQRTFQIITIVSFQERKRADQIPFSSHRRTEGDGLVFMTAEPRPWRGPSPLPLDAQFVPTLTRTSGYSILASHQTLAREIVETIRAREAREEATATGDQLQLYFGPIRTWLERHEDLLATSEVLDNGKTFDQAVEEQRGLRKILRLFEELSLSIEPGTDRTELRMGLLLAERRAR